MVYVGISLSIYHIMSSERIWQSSLPCFLVSAHCGPTEHASQHVGCVGQSLGPRIGVRQASRLSDLSDGPAHHQQRCRGLGVSLGGAQKTSSTHYTWGNQWKRQAKWFGAPQILRNTHMTGLHMPCPGRSHAKVQARLLREFLESNGAGQLDCPGTSCYVLFGGARGHCLWCSRASAPGSPDTPIWISFRTDLWQVLQVLPSFSFFLSFFPSFFSFYACIMHTQHHSTIKQPGGVAKGQGPMCKRHSFSSKMSLKVSACICTYAHR